jgi:signal transduction histidine kinase
MLGSERRHSEDSVPDYKHIRFEVEDTGIGIPPEEIERIFLPFEQVRECRLQTEGEGLGLSISQKLVRLMGGELLVNSIPGKGSLFWFDLDLLVSSAFEGLGINNVEKKEVMTSAAKLLNLQTLKPSNI